MYDWFAKDSKQPNSEDHMASFLSGVLQNRDASVSFETLSMLTGVVDDNPYRNVISQSDTSLYLNLLFNLNCNNTEHALDKVYTTTARITERVEKILNEYVSPRLSRLLMQ
jgi:hypothetical protein